MQQSEDTVKGFGLAVSSYVLWGIFPIYFFLLRHVTAFEVLVHRVIWSMLLLLLISAFINRQTKWYDLLKTKEALIPCLFSTLFLSINWVIYIWAVANSMAIEGSLGYFINPLISVLMAVIFLGERLNKYQLSAIGFAVIGVLFLIFKVGEFPWVALSLALSFGIYGLIHKKFEVDAFAGLTLETIIAAPLAIAYLTFLFVTGQNAFLSTDWQTDSLLLAAGIITSLPLLLYLASLPQLRLSTVGLLQYIAPTLQFLVAVYILNEPFNIIWIGLFIFSFDTIRQRRLRNKNP